MNQFYFKYLFSFLLIAALSVFQSVAQSKRIVPHRQTDRVDLIANVHKVKDDYEKIDALKNKIKGLKEADKKALKSHKQKLTLEKKTLHSDCSLAKDEENSYLDRKKEKIKGLKKELKASDEKYEAIRKSIRKDLAKRNDFTLQKNAAELLKAVQKKNETSTELAMEKSDLISTVEALDKEWKKVRSGQRHSAPAVANDNTLSNVK
jgi:hypothetical protein